MDFAWREGTLPTCGCVGYFTVVIPASGIPQNAKFQNGVHLGALSPTLSVVTLIALCSCYMFVCTAVCMSVCLSARPFNSAIVCVMTKVQCKKSVLQHIVSFHVVYL